MDAGTHVRIACHVCHVCGCPAPMEGVEEGSAQSLQHQQLRPVATVITCSVFDLLLQLLQAPALSALCMYPHTSVMHVLCMRYLRAMRAA